MSATVLTDRHTAERRLDITRKLSGELLDRVDQLQHDLRVQDVRDRVLDVRDDIPGAGIIDQVDAIVTLTCVLHDELAEVELP